MTSDAENNMASTYLGPQYTAREDFGTDDIIFDLAVPISEELGDDFDYKRIGLAHGFDKAAAASAVGEVVRREGKRRADEAEAAEEAAKLRKSLVPAVSLAELLEEPDSETPYRVENMWPANGRMNLVAQAKTGKTTFLKQLVKCLVDGGKFLGAFDVQPIPDDWDGPAVVIFDVEMTRDQLRAWYRGMNFEHPERVVMVPLRGHALKYDLTNPAIRDMMVKEYGGAHTYIFDPVAQLLNAGATGTNNAEDSSGAVTKFLASVDTFVQEAGGRESIVSHHAGHAEGGRARGSSVWMDSGDALVTLTKASKEPDARRHLSVVGRDVEVKKTPIDFNRVTREMTLADTATSQFEEQSAEEMVTFAMEGLRGKEPLGKTDLVSFILEKYKGSLGRNEVTAVLDEMHDSGHLVKVDGPRKNGTYLVLPEE